MTTPTPAGAPAPASPDHRPARRFHQSGLTQLFLIPLAVCLASLGIFWMFARISVSDRPVEELISKIKNEGGTVRWEAANELVRLANRKPEILRDPKVADALLDAWGGAKHDNPATRRMLAMLLGRTVEVRDYFALALARTGDERVVPILLEALELPSEEDRGQSRIYILVALGNTGDARALPALLKASEDPDAAQRTAAAYALGSLGAAAGEEGKARLRRLVEDESLDTRWNAALALARLRDGAGEQVLLQMTDRDALAKLTYRAQAQDPRTGALGDWKEYPLKPARMSDAINNGLKGLALIRSASLEARLKTIIAGDPDYTVRENALKLQQALPGIHKQLDAQSAAAPPEAAAPAAGAPASVPGSASK